MAGKRKLSEPNQPDTRPVPRFLCWLGAHDWSYSIHFPAVCRRCGRMQEEGS